MCRAKVTNFYPKCGHTETEYVQKTSCSCRRRVPGARWHRSGLCTICTSPLSFIPQKLLIPLEDLYFDIQYVFLTLLSTSWNAVGGFNGVMAMFVISLLALVVLNAIPDVILEPIEEFPRVEITTPAENSIAVTPANYPIATTDASAKPWWHIWPTNAPLEPSERPRVEITTLIERPIYIVEEVVKDLTAVPLPNNKTLWDYLPDYLPSKENAIWRPFWPTGPEYSTEMILKRVYKGTAAFLATVGGIATWERTALPRAYAARLFGIGVAGVALTTAQGAQYVLGIGRNVWQLQVVDTVWAGLERLLGY